MAKRSSIYLFFLACTFRVMLVEAQFQHVYCSLLDLQEDPISHAMFGFVPESRIEGFGGAAQLEVTAGAGLFYKNMRSGELDIHVAFDSFTFTSRGDIRLPDHVAAIRLEADYAIRTRSGNALRLGCAPGFYSEFSYLEMDHFEFPFRIHAIRALRPDVSALLGVNVYPGFNRVYQPEIGVRWVVSNFLLLDAFYPKSEIQFRPNFEWTIRVGMEIRDGLEYNLKHVDDRQSLIMDETRMYVGVDRLMRNNSHFMFRVGRVVNRKYDFGRFERGADVGDAYFVQIGVGSYL